ncbi:MAG TPA: hypothetical protein VH916_10195 [Dehalococcoidia bacterium]
MAPDPYAGRDADRLAYLLHRLKHPDAPPLLLAGWPEDERLASFARELHARLSAPVLASLIADMERMLAIYHERGEQLHCLQCHTALAAPRMRFCDAVCEATYHAERV